MADQFRVGQLVECINDTPRAGTLDGLQKGRVYTVRWCGRHQRVLYIRIVEIGGAARDPHDFPYLAARFRPVDASRLEIFRLMLARKKRARRAFA